jgi:hypothetical protein
MSAGKKNDNKSNPIEVIALEISEGVNVLATKLIEFFSGLIQAAIESFSKKSGASSKKNASIVLKKGFKNDKNN